MFAARVRASLKPLLHGRHSSYLTRNCEIAAIPRRILLLERFRDGEKNQNSLRLSGNGVEIKLFDRSFHSSSVCYTDEGVKTQTSALFSSLEDDCFSELGSVEKDGNQNMVVKLLTTAPQPLEVAKEELSQKTKGKKKKKKKTKKKPEQDSDTICKPKLLTEKPAVSWETSGKRKTEAHASSPARNVKGSNASSSSPAPGQKSKPQNIISSGFKAKNETSSKASKHPSSLAIVIRISNLNSETTDSVIRTMCLKIGPLEGLARVDEDTADVLFRARNLNEADSMLKELNDATVDHCQWRAEIVPEAGEASRDEMGMRVSSCFEDLEKQMTMQRILSKDLEVLLHLVTHLESHPMMSREGT